MDVDNFIKIKNNSFVYCMLCRLSKIEQIMKNRGNIMSIIKTIVMCGKQDILI